jgi:hypothetical protein
MHLLIHTLIVPLDSEDIERRQSYDKREGRNPDGTAFL